MKAHGLVIAAFTFFVFGTGILMVPQQAQADDEAAALWSKKCASCHGKDGTAATKAGKKLGVKDLTDSEVRAAFDADRMFKSIKEGIKKEGGDKFAMKAYAETFTDEQIKALVTYSMSFGAVEPESPPSESEPAE